MSGVTCSNCGAPLERTSIGEVTEPISDRYVQRRYGTRNHPCGCIDGGLRFDFTGGES